jgi:hypothetical protein
MSAVGGAGVGEVGPSGDEGVREVFLFRVQGVRLALGAAMPEGEEILEVSRVVGEGHEARHAREIGGRGRVVEFAPGGGACHRSRRWSPPYCVGFVNGGPERSRNDKAKICTFSYTLDKKLEIFYEKSACYI